MSSFKKVNRNILFIAGAVVFGLIAAFLSVGYVQQKAEEARAAAQPKPRPETQVVVPIRDIPAGERIQGNVLSARNVPVDFVPADAIIPGDHERYVGRVTRYALKQGVPISAGALMSSHDQFSRVVTPGNVAYTFSVNENNSISGMISPGDRIDLLLTYSPDRLAGGSSGDRNLPSDGDRVIPLLENIHVLAVGTDLESVPGEIASGYSSITLELDPQQAEQLTVAQEAGKMRVVLRNLDDRTPFGLMGLTERGLLSEYEGTSSGVHFIIGGRK